MGAVHGHVSCYCDFYCNQSDQLPFTLKCWVAYVYTGLFHCQPQKAIPEHSDLLTLLSGHCISSLFMLQILLYTLSCTGMALHIFIHSQLYFFFMWNMKCCFCKYTLLGIKMKNSDLGQHVPDCIPVPLLNGLMCSFVTGLYFYKLSAVLISKNIYNDVITCQ